MTFAEKYEILNLLGEQKKRKFSQVFLIKNKISNEEFVLKYLSKNEDNQFEFSQLKIEASRTFKNSGLPQVIETYETEEEFFLVLKFKKGEVISSYFKSLNKIAKIESIIQISTLLLPIFEELKDSGIVHCDIKPTNIIYDPIQNEIHLIDFGLSINLEEKNERKRIFQLGFAAPELILNQLNLISKKTDAFSLALVYWTLIESRLPFSESNPTIYTNLQISHPLPNLSKKLKAIDLFIQNATIKPKFTKNLNRLSQTEIEKELIKTINQRIEPLEFLQKMSQLTIKKNRLIPNIFSVT
jgi:serine/threonine protein kinase